MSFLISQIKEQKLIEKDIEVDKFIEENGITENHMVYRFIFDKSVFKEEKEVREYLRDKYFYEVKIKDEDGKFIADTLAQNQLDEDTKLEVIIRRGVTIEAAEFLPVMTFETVTFNDKGEVNLSCKFGEIHLNNGGLPHVIEIARVAEGEHPAYGKLKITQEDLESMELNFKSKVVGIDLAVNEDHAKKEAFGWFKDVYLSFDKQTLYGQVSWNSKGVTSLSEKEYRYFSPEFRFNYVHPHTGKSHGPTLLGGALTNYPFLKMDAITELSSKNNLTGEKEVSTITLLDHDKKVVELNSKISEKDIALNDAISQKNELQTKLNESNKKLIELNEKIEKKEKEAKHEKLFTEGKISKAQLVALNEGKDLFDVLNLSEKMNTTSIGTDSPDGTSTSEIQLSDKEKNMCKSLGITAEEFLAAKNL